MDGAFKLLINTRGLSLYSAGVLHEVILLLVLICSIKIMDINYKVSISGAVCLNG